MKIFIFTLLLIISFLYGSYAFSQFLKGNYRKVWPTLAMSALLFGIIFSVFAIINSSRYEPPSALMLIGQLILFGGAYVVVWFLWLGIYLLFRRQTTANQEQTVVTEVEHTTLSRTQTKTDITHQQIALNVRQANQLWQTYTAKNAENFWQAYENLLDKARRN